MLDLFALLRPAVSVFALICLCAHAVQAEPKAETTRGKADHVVLVVWDGMRPDFITAEYTPNLWRLRTEGVFFSEHHSAYISSTEVNGAALATGSYPGNNGIIANNEYRPEVHLLAPVATESLNTIRRIDALSGGHYLQCPTIAEVLHEADMRTTIAGTKQVTVLADRAARRKAGKSTMVYLGRTKPSSALAQITALNGKSFPAAASPNRARDEWTTDALVKSLWKDGVPPFSMLWLSEPDSSQHDHGPGSTNALAGLASSDSALGQVLMTLETKGVRSKTDVLVVSDHGFSTIERGVDVADYLKKAGIRATRELDDPEPGDVLVVGLGGSVLCYVIDHEVSTVKRVVESLQSSDFAGVIFCKEKLPGTFSLDQAKLNAGRNQPDVVLSLQWREETNKFGIPGLLTSDKGTKDHGTHASLSRYDVHNTLVACGPDFRQGYVDPLPTGNIDVHPTVLWVLGVADKGKADGRVLTEALTCGLPEPAAQRQRIEAEVKVRKKLWHQYLDISTCEGRVYFNEGNGGVR